MTELIFLLIQEILLWAIITLQMLTTKEEKSNQYQKTISVLLRILQNVSRFIQGEVMRTK